MILMGLYKCPEVKTLLVDFFNNFYQTKLVECSDEEQMHINVEMNEAGLMKGGMEEDDM